MSRYFWPILTPLPLSHFVTHPGTPPKYVTHLEPPIFSSPSTKKSGQKPHVQILSHLFARAFVRVLLSEGLLSGRFCPGWFLSVPSSVRMHLLHH